MTNLLIGFLFILLALNGLLVWWVINKVQSELETICDDREDLWIAIGGLSEIGKMHLCLLKKHRYIIDNLQSQIKQLNVKLKTHHDIQI
jgi:hypothetical protein